MTSEKAYVGNGCFWCTEAVFQRMKGVSAVQSGYSGGTTSKPTYPEVSTGNTGHAECLEITYDNEIVSYWEILEVFWGTHDPTTMNRQGNDVGTQYRSIIFYTSQQQKEIAEKYMQQLTHEGIFRNPIVTIIEPLTTFFPAENYHQDYYNKNGFEPYCQLVVRPKVEKFKDSFGTKLKT